jgi:DNA-binding CsgD family transcriptional regulator
MGLLSSLLAGVPERGAALLLRGPVGSGKSALLADASARAEANGMRALRVSGVRQEADVAFAGLHRLIRPFAGQIPPPTVELKCDALFTDLAKKECAAPDTIPVAVATLKLFAAAAKEGPLLVAVDDTQWLDPATACVLGFVARRLHPEPVALLIAVRDGDSTPLVDAGLPVLHVANLDGQSSAALLDARAPGLRSAVRARVLSAAAGNPLALVELPLAAESLPVRNFALPEQPLLTDRLTQVLLEPFFRLPGATQALLLVASADDHLPPNEVRAAAALLDKRVPVSLDDFRPAMTSGLIEHDNPHVRFRNPLLPAAIYQAAGMQTRDCVHAALATTLTCQPHRRAWHQAVSTTVPDEAVAVELELVSQATPVSRANNLGLAAIERAAELTPEGPRRHHRLLCAAELALEMGGPDRASRLLHKIDPARCEPLDRARIGMAQGTIEPGLLVGPNAVSFLLESADLASSAANPDLALRLLEAAALHAWWADLGPQVGNEVIAGTERVPISKGEPRVMSIRAIAQPGAHSAPLYEAASRIAAHTCDISVAYSLGSALHIVGAVDLSAEFLAVAVVGLRTEGRMWRLAQALAHQAWNTIYIGDWNTAMAAAEESAHLARDTNQPLWEAMALTARSMLGAIRGDGDAAQTVLRAEAIALPLKARAVLCDLQAVRAVAASGAGRYDEACDHLIRVFDPHDPAHHSLQSVWCIGEFAEAAAYAGRLADAHAPLARCEEMAHQRQSTRLDVGLAYALPLLKNDATTESRFQHSLSAQLTTWPFYRARLLLQYGTWLRRRRRIAGARMPLRSARDSFVALGAGPWAERTRQELRAAREAHNREPAKWWQLTEQEQQIAKMAAEGLSNREIAQSLYISPRTVGSHLYKIFPKLGIASRAQLAVAIGNLAPTNESS